jgi:putative sigma-54 modulation protein
MQISITGRHMDITDGLRDYTHKRIEHALGEFPRVESVHVILEVEKYRQRAEVVVQAKNHIRVDAREESDDMYASIDGAVEKTAKQLRRFRDKVLDHKSREPLHQVEQEIQSQQGPGPAES